jgi:hypothetical protein
LDQVIFPDSLENLQFGQWFNQSLEGVTWPSSLKNLKLSDKFQQSLEGVNMPRTFQTLVWDSVVISSARCEKRVAKSEQTWSESFLLWDNQMHCSKGGEEG